MNQSNSYKWFKRAAWSGLAFALMMGFGQNIYIYLDSKIGAYMAIIGYCGLFVPLVCAFIGRHYENKGD